jgi:hypothetical protein
MVIQKAVIVVFKEEIVIKICDHINAQTGVVYKFRPVMVLVAIPVCRGMGRGAISGFCTHRMPKRHIRTGCEREDGDHRYDQIKEQTLTIHANLLHNEMTSGLSQFIETFPAPF